MLINSDWREDLRLLRLNNPSYRPLFILMDVVKWGLYLAGAALLVAFCWQVLSPRAPVYSSPGLSHNSGEGPSIVATLPAAEPRHSAASSSHSTEEISQARIDYLKKFASRARADEQTVALDESDKQTDNAALNVLPERGDVTVQAVVQPDQIEAVVIPATARDAVSPAQNNSTIPTTVDLVSSDLAAPDPAANTDSATSADGATALDDDDQGDAVVSESLAEEVIALVAEDSVLSTTVTLRESATAEPGRTNLETETEKEKRVAYTSKNRAYQSSQWVLAQKASHYTIQIGATVNKPFLLRFIDTLPDKHVVALFKHRVNRANKEEYVLSYGSFASYELANIALEKLSQSNRRYGAYARSFNTIHSEIKNLQTVTAQVLPNNVGHNSANGQ